MTQYRRSWGQWLKFCQAGHISGILPTDPTVAAHILGCYVTYGHTIKGLQAGTMRGRAAAVLHYHRVRNLACPTLAHPFLAAVLKGAERASGPPSKRQPLFLHTIAASRPAAGGAALDFLLWRGVLLSFHLLLRTSEIWAGWNGRAHPLYCISAAAVTIGGWCCGWVSGWF